VTQYFDGNRIQVIHHVGDRTFAYSGPVHGEAFLWFLANVAVARAGEVMRERDRRLVSQFIGQSKGVVNGKN
jgi:hypothetical protein